MTHRRSISFVVSIVYSFVFITVFMIRYCQGAQITVRGRVDAPKYLQGSDGEIYELADCPVSEEILKTHTGELVRLKGDIEYSEEADMMILTPEQYDPITSGEDE